MVRKVSMLVWITFEQMEEGEAAMSLLTESMESFTIINKLAVPDGLGSVTTTYVDGAEIKGAMPYDNSTQVKVAQAMGVKAVYTLTVRKKDALDYLTILRRERDKKYFRLTSGTDDKQTPASASLDMRQYSVEEFDIGGT